MTDFALSMDADALIFDLVPSSETFLVEVSGLETAVMASLFTWRRAERDDPLPDPSASDRRGYWGDSFAIVNGRRVGSRLWLLARRVLSPVVAEEARQMCLEALAWLIEDGVVAAVEVGCTIARPRRLNVLVVLRRHDGTAVNLEFGDVWNDILEAA